MWQYNYTPELYHHGIKGQKWGVRRFQNKDGTLTSEGKRHYNTESDGKSSYFTDEQKAKAIGYAKTGAKIAAGIAVAYGAHKLINDPRVLQSGMNIAKNVNSKYGSMKTSAIGLATSAANGIKGTTEFKAVSKAASFTAKTISGSAKNVKTVGGKVANFVSDDKTRKFLLGIGTMTGTANALNKQIKDLKKQREYSDDREKALDYIKRYSEIGANVSTLAKGPMRQNTNGNQSFGKNKNSNNSNNATLIKARNFKEIVGNPKGGQRTPEQEKEYQSFFNGADEETRGIIKAMRRNYYSNEQIKQIIQIIQHSDLIYGESLYHHGIKGQKWGVRRFQNKDGSLTKEGLKRYNTNPYADNSFKLSSNQKKALKIGAAVAATTLVAYGGYKLNKYVKTENVKLAIERGNSEVDRLVKEYGETKSSRFGYLGMPTSFKSYQRVREQASSDMRKNGMKPMDIADNLDTYAQGYGMGLRGVNYKNAEPLAYEKFGTDMARVKADDISNRRGLREIDSLRNKLDRDITYKYGKEAYKQKFSKAAKNVIADRRRKKMSRIGK